MAELLRKYENQIKQILRIIGIEIGMRVLANGIRHSEPEYW